MASSLCLSFGGKTARRPKCEHEECEKENQKCKTRLAGRKGMEGKSHSMIESLCLSESLTRRSKTVEMSGLIEKTDA